MNYFGKPVQELTLAECASLISITNNPTIYGPYSDAVFTNSETGEQKTARDKNKERQELVLWSMLDQGYITQEEYDEAVAQELARLHEKRYISRYAAELKRRITSHAKQQKTAVPATGKARK